MEKLMTYQKIATQLDLSVRFIAKLVRLGEIPFVKIGKSVRFKPNEIEKYVERRSSTPSSGLAPSASLVSMRKKLTIVKTNGGVV